MKIQSENGAKTSMRKKETLILVVVFAGLLIAVVYMMVYTPLREETAALSDQLQTLDTELNAKTARVQLLPSLEKELSLLDQSGMELYNRFYGMVDQEEFIFVLHRYAQESGIVLERVSFESDKSGLSDVFLAQPEPEEEPAQEDAETDETADEAGQARFSYLQTVKMTDISLDISGEYEKCIRFLNLLHINEREIAVADVLFERTTEDEEPLEESSEESSGALSEPMTTPVRGAVALMIFHVPEADNIHRARDESKASGGEWIAGADDPFDASVIASGAEPSPREASDQN